MPGPAFPALVDGGPEESTIAEGCRCAPAPPEFGEAPKPLNKVPVRCASVLQPF
jgi:hypothetical protein